MAKCGRREEASNTDCAICKIREMPIGLMKTSLRVELRSSQWETRLPEEKTMRWSGPIFPHSVDCMSSSSNWPWTSGSGDLEFSSCRFRKGTHLGNQLTGSLQKTVREYNMDGKKVTEVLVSRTDEVQVIMEAKLSK